MVAAAIVLPEDEKATCFHRENEQTSAVFELNDLAYFENLHHLINGQTPDGEPLQKLLYKHEEINANLLLQNIT